MRKPASSEHREFHRRNLPHWYPKGAVLFVTTRLHGSLPTARIAQLRTERDDRIHVLQQRSLAPAELERALADLHETFFLRYDGLLDRPTTGPRWLARPDIATLWVDALRHFDGRLYTVICSTVMSNHVHFVFYRLTRSLPSIMQSLKGYTARRANTILERPGQPFWQAESYDHIVRNRASFRKIIAYVLHNPVEVGLVNDWRAYPFNYLHPDFEQYLQS